MYTTFYAWWTINRFDTFGENKLSPVILLKQWHALCVFLYPHEGVMKLYKAGSPSFDLVEVTLQCGAVTYDRVRFILCVL